MALVVNIPSLNPVYYLKHAWEKTHSYWGKFAIVLFYSFVWIQILWAIQILIAPTLGFDCLLNQLGPFSKRMVISFNRTVNLFTLGMLIHADREGIKVWNVTLVTVIFCTYMNMIQFRNYEQVVVNDKDMFDKPTCSESDILSMRRSFLWLFAIWPVTALVCSIMDTFFKEDGGSSDGDRNSGSTSSSSTIPSMNPMYYLKRAWNATNSVWGKLAIVVFYTFLWFQIVFSVIGIILENPLIGYECYFDNVGPYGALLSTILARQGNLMAVGFLLYANRGGIKSIWNVIMVTVVFSLYMYMLSTTFQDVDTLLEMEDGPTCTKEEMVSGMKTLFYINIDWPLVATVLTIMERLSAGPPAPPSGGTSSTSPGERTPLI